MAELYVVAKHETEQGHGTRHTLAPTNGIYKSDNLEFQRNNFDCCLFANWYQLTNFTLTTGPDGKYLCIPYTDQRLIIQYDTKELKQDDNEHTVAVVDNTIYFVPSKKAEVNIREGKYEYQETASRRGDLIAAICLVFLVVIFFYCSA
jgi:hypothetical protein